MKTTIEIEFVKGDDYYCKDVEFTAEPEYINDGIGSYEYWGQNCYDKGNTYISCENSGITWDKSLYTDYENEVIQSEFDRIDQEICDQYEEECNSRRCDL